MNKTTLGIGIIVLIAIIAGAYLAFANKKEAQPSAVNQMGATTTPTNSGENPQPGSEVHDLPVEPAAAEARADLAAKLGVSERSIVILLVEEETWTDGCLGLGGPAESCLQALVDGFRVELTAQGKTYVYRTDKTGASVRLETN